MNNEYFTREDLKGSGGGFPDWIVYLFLLAILFFLLTSCSKEQTPPREIPVDPPLLSTISESPILNESESSPLPVVFTDFSILNQWPNPVNFGALAFAHNDTDGLQIIGHLRAIGVDYSNGGPTYFTLDTDSMYWSPGDRVESFRLYNDRGFIHIDGHAPAALPYSGLVNFTKIEILLK